jgi:alkylation response protein AidB-like acyl-CoA dehydrogenase
MNFDYSDDQKSLKGETRRFLEQNCTPRHVRAVLDDPSVSFDQTLWSKVAEMGWLGAAIPEEHGGLGLGHVELCAIAEELGRAVAPIPFSSTVYFVAEAVMLAGSDEQKAYLLPKIAAGELVGCFATSEGPGAVTAESLQSRVRAAACTGPRSP